MIPSLRPFLLFLFSYSVVQAQIPDRQLSEEEQLAFDQIFMRLKPGIEGYYNGHPLLYGALFHDDGVYAGQTNRYSGRSEIDTAFGRWEGKTKFEAKVSDAQFTMLDAAKAILSYRVKEDDHTLWLGSEVWTLKAGTWGLSYAHWASIDLNVIFGLPAKQFWYMGMGLFSLVIASFIIGRSSAKKKASKD